MESEMLMCAAVQACNSSGLYTEIVTCYNNSYPVGIVQGSGGYMPDKEMLQISVEDFFRVLLFIKRIKSVK